MGDGYVYDISEDKWKTQEEYYGDVGEPDIGEVDDKPSRNPYFWTFKEGGKAVDWKELRGELETRRKCGPVKKYRLTLDHWMALQKQIQSRKVSII